MSSFEALRLRPELLKACVRQGFSEPTPIQALVIPRVAEGRDVVVESQTGSGKTLAWGLPLLDREPLQTASPEVLVVVPTRELAEQSVEALRRASGTLARPVALLTGRGGLDRQKQALEAGAVFVVGTLGRLEEAIARSILKLDGIRTVVLDEVDELLKGGFSGQLAALLGSLPKVRQTLLFSATVPTEVEQVAKKFTRDAVRLRTSEAREHPAHLRHRVLFTNVAERVANLAGYLKADRPYQTIVFCGTRHETEEVKAALDEAGLEASFLHGELSPLKRRQLLDRFRTGDLPVLVASDLAARGLDLPGVDLIVNYSLPAGSAAYLHRAGRTGRAGREGTVLSLVIEQQHVAFERLKGTFAFESMAVSSNGKLYSHPARSQAERDQLVGQKPEKPPRGAARPFDPEVREGREGREGRPGREGREGREGRPPRTGGSTSTPRTGPSSRAGGKTGGRTPGAFGSKGSTRTAGRTAGKPERGAETSRDRVAGDRRTGGSKTGVPKRPGTPKAGGRSAKSSSPAGGRRPGASLKPRRPR